MKFRSAIDQYVADQRAQGRIASDGTEAAYRKTLLLHAEDVDNRDPSYTNRQDVKRTLGRWSHPNTQANRRAILVSFYDWAMEEGVRKDNPARQTRRPRKRQAQVYRLTFEETGRLLDSAQTRRERRVIFLGICAGLRSKELRGVQGRHFDRPGWVWVSPDIAKGNRERWVPVIPDLEPVVAEIQEHLAPNEYVIPAQQVWNLQPNRPARDVPLAPCSAQALWRLVERVGTRAGIAAHIHPHLLRHAFGDHIARYAGMRNAQFLLGHADIGTTETYTGAPTLDELAAAIRGFTFGANTNKRSTPAELELQGQVENLAEKYPGLSPAGNLVRNLWHLPLLREAAKEMA